MRIYRYPPAQCPDHTTRWTIACKVCAMALLLGLGSLGLQRFVILPPYHCFLIPHRSEWGDRSHIHVPPFHYIYFDFQNGIGEGDCVFINKEGGEKLLGVVESITGLSEQGITPNTTFSVSLREYGQQGWGDKLDVDEVVVRVDGMTPIPFDPTATVSSSSKVFKYNVGMEVSPTDPIRHAFCVVDKGTSRVFRVGDVGTLLEPKSIDNVTDYVCVGFLRGPPSPTSRDRHWHWCFVPLSQIHDKTITNFVRVSVKKNKFMGFKMSSDMGDRRVKFDKVKHVCQQMVESGSMQPQVLDGIKRRRGTNKRKRSPGKSDENTSPTPSSPSQPSPSKGASSPPPLPPPVSSHPSPSNIKVTSSQPILNTSVSSHPSLSNVTSSQPTPITSVPSHPPTSGAASSNPPPITALPLPLPLPRDPPIHMTNLFDINVASCIGEQFQQTANMMTLM